MPEDPKDINMSSEGPRTSSEDHRAKMEEEEEDLSLGMEGKKADKASITSAFNTLNSLSWPH